MTIAQLVKKIVSEVKPITKEEAVNDYEKLQLIPCNKINNRSLIGNKSTDYFFFKYRIKAIGDKGISFLDFIKNIEKYNKTKYYKSLKDYYIKKVSFYNEYKLNYEHYRLYYGSVSQFKPIIAKYIYCKYKAENILDFSAGWGGRCVASMALNLNYIGIDSNILLKTPYKNMIKLYNNTSNIKMIFQDSATIDYSKLDYNFVFTSPPYYNKQLIEKYEKMPIYSSREEFNDKFFFIVVKNSYKYMKKGTFILNIPEYMYNDIIQVIGKCDKKEPLFISGNNYDNYKEFIYIWFKK